MEIALLSRIRIVLVETTHPGNIGGVARAMKNMGLSDLALVKPHYFPDSQASARASGADDILDRAGLYEDIASAVAGCHVVMGASARLRSIRWPEFCPRSAASHIVAQDDYVRTAILFGREHSGLTNEELERCHYLLHIPSDPDFSSLNLAAAVQVVAYELRVAQMAGVSGSAELPLDREEGEQLASGAVMLSFYGHLEQALKDFGYLHERRMSPSIMHRLHRIFNRSHLENAEVHLLRGILGAGQREIARRQVVGASGEDQERPAS